MSSTSSSKRPTDKLMIIASSAASELPGKCKTKEVQSNYFSQYLQNAISAKKWGRED